MARMGRTIWRALMRTRPTRWAAIEVRSRYLTATQNRRRLDAAYLEACREPLDHDLVLYESFHGDSAACSPLAIYLALREDPAYARLRHVFALNDPATAPPALDHPSTRVVRRESVEYWRLLARAGVLVNNSTFGTAFIRREGQVYANTWHGVPLKAMFKDERGALTAHRNSQRNFLQASHLLFPNAYTTAKLTGGSDMEEAVAHKVIEIGSPRVDMTLSADPEAIRAELGVAPGRRLVFIAPTWRGTMKQVSTETERIGSLVAAIGSALGDSHDVRVRLHNFMARAVGPGPLADRLVPDRISTNAVLAATDVLVTDYSSVMFDYLATGRPLVLDAWDREAYTAERGMYLDLESLPAALCGTESEVVQAVARAERADADPRYPAARDRFFPHEDGRAAGRAVRALLAGRVPDPRPPVRRRILFYAGGWKNNGITTSMLNLLDRIDPDRFEVFVVTAGEEIDGDQELSRNLRRAPPHVRLIHRSGRTAVTRAEDAALEAFYASDRFDGPKHEAVVRGIFRREARRLFGDLRFDAAIDFSGYARYWSMLIAHAPAARTAIYQHNHMLAEATSRFAVLKGVFATYRFFDRIVAVSEPTRRLNFENLGAYYPAPEASVAVPNVIDAAAIRAAVNAPALLRDGTPAPRPDRGSVKFVTMGRLSPEKAQDRAIEAIARLVAEGRDAVLYVLGDGPLRERLVEAARSAGVLDRIVFLGQVTNPFPVIAACDCFVLPSRYEGQPMVLLEALALGMPVIATDIPGSRSALEGTGALLVPESVEGLTDGMRQFAEGRLERPAFDADAYERQAIDLFYERVLGPA